MLNHPHTLFRGAILSLPALALLLFFSGCGGSANVNAVPLEPARVNAELREKVDAEIEAVFAPIDEKSELLDPRYR